MKFKKTFNIKKGFTLIEMQVYIFISTIIILELININVFAYYQYFKCAQLTKQHNNVQNFYLSLDKIISEENKEAIKTNDKEIEFKKFNVISTKSLNYAEIEKTISMKKSSIVVKYNQTNNFNNMLESVSEIEVKGKGKLIYLVGYEKNGEKIIVCL